MRERIASCRAPNHAGGGGADRAGGGGGGGGADGAGGGGGGADGAGCGGADDVRPMANLRDGTLKNERPSPSPPDGAVSASDPWQIESHAFSSMMQRLFYGAHPLKEKHVPR
jgi:hypothetical protein